MAGAMEQHHQAATPAPKALPRWEPPQHPPGSDNTALTSSHSLGRDPSRILLPFPTLSAVPSGLVSTGDGGAHGWQAVDSPGEMPSLASLSQPCRDFPPSAPALGAGPQLRVWLLVAGGAHQAHPAGDIVPCPCAEELSWHRAGPLGGSRSLAWGRFMG